MAMNNWGGVKEHMTKKPRRFMGNKKDARDVQFEKLHTKTDFSKEEKIRKKKMMRELLIYAIIFIAALFFFYFQK